MGNKDSRNTPTDSISNNANIRDLHQSTRSPSPQIIRNLCSQADCTNYEDLSNEMSFCTQCHTNYTQLFPGSSDTLTGTRHDQDCPSDSVLSTKDVQDAQYRSPMTTNPSTVGTFSTSTMSSKFRFRNRKGKNGGLLTDTASDKPDSSSKSATGARRKSNKAPVAPTPDCSYNITSYSNSDDDFEIVTYPTIPVRGNTNNYRSTNILQESEINYDIAISQNKEETASTIYDTIDISTGPNNQPAKTDSNEGLVKVVRDTLICPICLDLLENAKTLPCQHVVCKECLIKWVTSRGVLRCPTCNTSQPKPSGGVEGLPSNFMVNNLVAELKKTGYTGYN